MLKFFKEQQKHSFSQYLFLSFLCAKGCCKQRQPPAAPGPGFPPAKKPRVSAQARGHSYRFPVCRFNRSKVEHVSQRHRHRHAHAREHTHPITHTATEKALPSAAPRCSAHTNTVSGNCQLSVGWSGSKVTSANAHTHTHTPPNPPPPPSPESRAHAHSRIPWVLVLPLCPTGTHAQILGPPTCPTGPWLPFKSLLVLTNKHVGLTATPSSRVLPNTGTAIPTAWCRCPVPGLGEIQTLAPHPSHQHQAPGVQPLYSPHSPGPPMQLRPSPLPALVGVPETPVALAADTTIPGHQPPSDCCTWPQMHSHPQHLAPHPYSAHIG